MLIAMYDELFEALHEWYKIQVHGVNDASKFDTGMAQAQPISLPHHATLLSIKCFVVPDI